MKTKQPIVITANLADNSHRMENLSRNRISWHLQAISWAEKWILKNIQGLDPASDRIIRFYTYNDEEGQDFEYEVPNYKFDLTSCLYDDFIKTSNEIGQMLQKNYGIKGRYFYDIKVSLEYTKINDQLYNAADGVQYTLNYTWEILKTDNPRCIFGNPTYRKDCDYLKSAFSPKLMIEGYTLSGNYRKFVDILSDLFSKTIIVHSKADVKALMRIMKFLGVNHVMKGGKFYPNNPNKRAFFSKYVYGYQLGRVNGQTIICAVQSMELPAHPDDILDIDELIVKRTLKSKLRDMRKVG